MRSFPVEAGVYLLKFENGCKFGVSCNLKRRLQDYRKKWCRPLLGACCWTEKKALFDSVKFEKMFLDSIDPSLKQGEFISLPYEELRNKVMEAIKEYHGEHNEYP